MKFIVDKRTSSIEFLYLLTVFFAKQDMFSTLEFHNVIHVWTPVPCNNGRIQIDTGSCLGRTEISRIINFRPTTPEGMPSLPPPHFFAYQKEKRETKEKRKSFKAETIKRLSPRSKCYCFNHSGASRIQKFLFRPTMVADITFQYSVSPPLWSPFYQPYKTKLGLN